MGMAFQILNFTNTAGDYILLHSQEPPDLRVEKPEDDELVESHPIPMRFGPRLSGVSVSPDAVKKGSAI
jgi:hypothetical protein